MIFEGEMEREDWLERTVGGVVAKSSKLDGNYYVVVFCSPRATGQQIAWHAGMSLELQNQ